MKRTLAFLILFSVLLPSAALADDSDIATIQNGKFSMCKDRTVKQAINNAFENPYWESAHTLEGDVLVNAIGDVTWNGEMYNVVIQFSVQGERFKTVGISFNWQTMGDDFKKEFIQALCSL